MKSPNRAVAVLPMTRRLVTGCLAAVFLLSSLCHGQQPSGDVVIQGGHFFDTESGTFLANPGMLISDGKFAKLN